MSLKIGGVGLSGLLCVSEGVQVEERVHLMKIKGLNGSKSKCYCKECSRSIKRPLGKINKLSYSVPYGTQYLVLAIIKLEGVLMAIL